MTLERIDLVRRPPHAHGSGLTEYVRTGNFSPRPEVFSVATSGPGVVTVDLFAQPWSDGSKILAGPHYLIFRFTGAAYVCCSADETEAANGCTANDAWPVSDGELWEWLVYPDDRFMAILRAGASDASVRIYPSSIHYGNVVSINSNPA